MSAHRSYRRKTEPGEPEKWFRTPFGATERLLDVETFGPWIWDPACADGTIARVLEGCGHHVVGTDLYDRGYGESGVDFLEEAIPRAPMVVSNPPLTMPVSFALHCLELGVKKFALFQRTAWLEGIGRHEALWRPHPPARVWQFSRRQTLWAGDDQSPKGNRKGAISFAWFVWELGQEGPPRLGWL